MVPRVRACRHAVPGTGGGGPWGRWQSQWIGPTGKHWQGAGTRVKAHEMCFSHRLQSVTDTSFSCSAVRTIHSVRPEAL